MQSERILRNQNIVSRTIDNEVILVPISHDVADLQFIYTFNEVGAFIWNHIDGGVSFDRILGLLVDHFKVREEQAVPDLEAFLKDLAAGNLIEIES